MIMGRPRRDGGLFGKLERSVPYVCFAVGVCLVVWGIHRYLHGSTSYRAVSGVVLVVLAGWDIYKDLRERRDRAAGDGIPAG